MQYRNRGTRCRHGFMLGVITCPVCQPPKYTRWRTIHSEGGHVVPKTTSRKPRIGDAEQPHRLAYKGR